MISKIIQKEKERQEYFINNRFYGAMAQHKQGLINLKEYMEEERQKIEDKMAEIGFPKMEDKTWSIKNMFLLGISNQFKENIQELKKMIERYK